MSEPRRPEPVMRWSDRLRERVVRSRDELRLRRQAMGAPAPLVAPSSPTDLSDGSVNERRSNVFGGLIVVGSAILVLSVMWGWQAWANRSAPPIDDLLPMLIVDNAEPTAALSTDVTVAPTAETIAEHESVDELAIGAAALTATTSVPAAAVEVIVHVSGAVRSPGIVVLSSGARVFEAVELAGGASFAADLDRVNLAAPIIDGERIHVPTHDEDVVPSLVPSVRSSATASADVVSDDPIIDINAASATELELLPGVGPAIAQAIVQTRVDRGPFLSLDELLEVPGIGETKLETLRPFAVAGP